MATDEARFLVFYSVPGDAARLRLDREERSIDDVLRDLRLDHSLIQRVHATSVEDFTRALQEGKFEIVQFSGHGNNEGILLEDRHQGNGVVVPAGEVSRILHEAAPDLKAVIFMSCFSAESIPELVEAAPYVITVIGAADDESAIAFITQFYRAYLRKESVEHAFNMAQNFIGLAGKSLNAILSRRALVKDVNKVLYQAFPSGKDDSILIDLSEAEADIKSWKISRNDFLGNLSRKIRIHRQIFDTPRQKVILSIGPYFGLFSWKDSKDIVNCHRILKIKPKVSEQTCDAWASLIVNYNDHYVDPYRTTQEPRDPKVAIWLPKTLEEYSKIYKDFFDTGEKAKVLRKAEPEQFRTSRAMIVANLEMAGTKLRQEDYASVAMHLEATLSAIHDLIDRLSVVLTIKQST
jgi:hypothetical protein